MQCRGSKQAPSDNSGTAGGRRPAEAARTASDASPSADLRAVSRRGRQQNVSSRGAGTRRRHTNLQHSTSAATARRRPAQPSCTQEQASGRAHLQDARRHQLLDLARDVGVPQVLLRRRRVLLHVLQHLRVRWRWGWCERGWRRNGVCEARARAVSWARPRHQCTPSLRAGSGLHLPTHHAAHPFLPPPVPHHCTHLAHDRVAEDGLHLGVGHGARLPLLQLALLHLAAVHLRPGRQGEVGGADVSQSLSSSRRSQGGGGGAWPPAVGTP